MQLPRPRAQTTLQYLQICYGHFCNKTMDFLTESHLKREKDDDEEEFLIISPGFRVKRENWLFAIFIGKKKSGRGKQWRKQV